MEDHRSKRWQQLTSHLTINKPLLPLKAVMFLYYAAVTMFMPYITLHMVQIGLSIEEVAIIYAILPFVSCLGSPTAGMIADKIGRYKPVLICGILFTGIFHTLLLTIDAGGNKLQDKANDSSVMQLTCAHDLSGEAFLEWPGCRNSSCLNNSLQISPVIHVSSCNCYEACNGTKTCDQQSLAINLDIQVEFGEMTGGHQHDMCKLPISQMLINNTTDPFVCPCQSQCIVSASGVSCQENQSEYDSNKHQRGFWLYLICRIIATASLGTTFTMLDASAICLVKKYKGDLGKQRLCGVIGSAAFGSVSGILIEWYSKVKGYKDYSITFYTADIFLLLVLVCILFLDVTSEKSKGNFWKNVMQLIRLVDVDIFLTMMLLLGTCWGFLEAYLFIYLIEMNASSYLLGFTVTLGSLVGLPFLYISDAIVKKLGKVVIIITAFFLYSARFIGYSFIQDPWLALPFEALEAVTIHLMGISMSMYCASAAPTGLLATLNGLAGAVHYSIGRGSGSYLGGTLIAAYGTRTTFRILGIGIGCCGIVYAIIYRFIMRKIEMKRMRQETVKLQEDVIDFHELKKVPCKSNNSDECTKSFLAVPDALLERRLSY